MAETAPTSFAEFEAQGGKYSPPAEPEPEPAEPKEPVEEPAEEPEPAEEEPAEAEEKKEEPAKPAGKRKLTLSEERDKLLKEVTELRKERRSYQQPAAAPSQPAPQPVSIDDKPPARPKLSTYPGTLEQYEAELEKYEEAHSAWVEKQWERKQAAQAQQQAQQRIDQEYNARVEKHIRTHPGFTEGLRNLPELPPLMVDICKREGPELVQLLIDDPGETARIVGLSPAQQVFELGRLAAGKNGKPAESAEEREPVKVPAKLSATGGASAANASKPGYGAKNFAEYEALAARYAQKRPGFVSRGK